MSEVIIRVRTRVFKPITDGGDNVWESTGGMMFEIPTDEATIKLMGNDDIVAVVEEMLSEQSNSQIKYMYHSHNVEDKSAIVLDGFSDAVVRVANK